MDKALQRQLIEIENMLQEIEAKPGLSPNEEWIVEEARRLLGKIMQQLSDAGPNPQKWKEVTPEQVEAAYSIADPETQEFIRSILSGAAREERAHQRRLRQRLTPLLLEHGFTESEINLMSGGELNIHLETIADKIEKKKRLEGK